MNLTLRRYRRGDLAGLKQAVDGVCASVPYMATSRFEPTPAWLQTLAHPAHPGHLLLVACDRDRVGGWCRLFPVQAGPGGTYELGIGLLPPYRGQGLGSALVRRVQGWARAQGARSILLETHGDNLPAIRCFRRCGFRDVGPGPADQLEMVWEATLPR